MLNKRLALGLLALTFISVFSAGTWAHHRASCWTLPNHEVYRFNGCSTGDYYTSYQEADNTWDNVTYLTTTWVSSPGLQGGVDNYDGFYGETGWAGLAVPGPYVGTCIIGHVDTLSNRTYLDNYGYYEKKVVACHELGHAWGLGHSTNTTSCTNTIYTSAVPDAHDIDTVNSIYGVHATDPSPTPTPDPGDGGGGGCGSNNLQCYPSLKKCLQSCCGVCERRINCGSETAHKCFE